MTSKVYRPSKTVYEVACIGALWYAHKTAYQVAHDIGVSVPTADRYLRGLADEGAVMVYVLPHRTNVSKRIYELKQSAAARYSRDEVRDAMKQCYMYAIYKDEKKNG